MLYAIISLGLRAEQHGLKGCNPPLEGIHMDVILDSNIFLSDPAFRGPQFGELFTYLRNTGSRLVVSALVQREVQARYRARLQSELDHSRSQWETVRKLLGYPQPELPHVDIDREVELMLARMKEPLRGVEAITLGIDDVSIAAVLERGVTRKRPASTHGEELRDVALWLSILNYAKARPKRAVTFISRDPDFAEKDGEHLHNDLQAELDSLALSVSFYPDLGRFLAAVCEKREYVVESWWNAVFPQDIVRDAIKNKMEGIPWQSHVAVHPEIESIKFSGGVKYDVGSGSAYAEVQYFGVAWVNLVNTLDGDPSHIIGHVHRYDENHQIVDQWMCTFSVRFAARIEDGKVASWQIGEITDLNCPMTKVR